MAKAKKKAKKLTKKKPAAPKEKRPVGRPPWIPTEATLKEVENYAALGLTEEQIADCIGISVSTWCEKKKEYAEFLEAIKRGKAKGIAFHATKVMEAAREKNLTASIFFLKAQARWKEATDHNVNLGGKVTLAWENEAKPGDDE